MKRRICCVLLVLLLSGCGARPETEEYSVLSKAAQMDENTILMRVNGQEQPAWKYLYWLAKDVEQIRLQYQQADMALDWAAPQEDGKTLADYVKEQAAADTALYAVVEQWAAEYGCTPAEKELLSDPLLTEKQAAELAAIGGMYSALFADSLRPDRPLTPAAGELELFAEQHDVIRLDRIFLRKEGEPDRAKQRIEELFARLNGMECTEQSFAELAAEGDDRAGPRMAESTGWESALDEVGRTLQAGQISGILETSEGFSVLYRLPQDMDTLREMYFDEMLQRTAEQSEVQVTEAYTTLNIPKFSEALEGILGGSSENLPSVLTKEG